MALNILSGALSGVSSGFDEMWQQGQVRAQRQGMIAAQRQALVRDLFAARTPNEMQSQLNALESAGVMVGQETRGRAIQNMTLRELGMNALATASSSVDPDQYAAAMTEAAQYLTKTGDLSPSDAVSIAANVSHARLLRHQQLLEMHAKNLVRTELAQAGEEVQRIGGTLGNDTLEQSAAVDLITKRADAFGIQITEAAQTALRKLPLPVLKKFIDRVGTSDTPEAVEPILGSQTPQEALAGIARFMSTPGPLPADAAAANEQPDERMEKILARQVQVARATAIGNPTTEAVKAWMDAVKEHENHKSRMGYTAQLKTAVDEGIRQYGETDPTGAPWSPQAKYAMGLVTQIRAMTELQTRLAGDGSEMARSMYKQLGDAISQANNLLDNVVGIKPTDVILNSMNRVLPGHYNPADPVHYAQLMSSPLIADQVLSDSRHIKIEEDVEKAERTKRAELLAEAEIKPTELQSFVVAATGKPLGSPITPDDLKKAREYQISIEVERAKQELEMRKSTEAQYANQVEEAAKISLMVAGLDSLEYMKKKLFKVVNGKVVVDRKALLAMDTRFPGSEGRSLIARATQAFWGTARPETGAQVGVQEMDSYLLMYGPTTLDSDATVIDKLSNLANLLKGTLGIRDPTGVLAEKARKNRLTPGSPAAKAHVEQLVDEVKKELGGKK